MFGAGGIGWWSETVFERLFLVAHSDFLGTVRGTRGVGWGGAGGVQNSEFFLLHQSHFLYDFGGFGAIKKISTILTETPPPTPCQAQKNVLPALDMHLFSFGHWLGHRRLAPQ